MKKPVLILLTIIAVAAVAVIYALKTINRYQLDGEIAFGSLDEPVTVHRDQNGIPYVFAASVADAIRTQGFVVGQDRVFQIEMYRAIIEGRLASLIGEAGIDSDIKMRVVGIHRNAVRHAEYLSAESRQYLRWYAEGYNAFIETRQHEFPFELGLLGIVPERIDVVDLLAVQHFAGFIQSRNYEDEILTLELTAELGLEKANELAPLNINPDRLNPVNPVAALSADPSVQINLFPLNHSAENRPGKIGAKVAMPASGSNNWVAGSSKTKNGKPILANDPHLDASILPGPWYPIGLFTPELQSVGANLPGVPGLMLGRTNYISFGITNAYGDSQDLYLEKLDPEQPDHYLEGEISKPFEVETVDLKVKDDSFESGFDTHTFTIRRTARGPVISDHQAFGIQSESPIVLRTAGAELTSNSLGLPGLLTAKNVTEADEAVAEIDVLYMNYVFADKNGGIAYRPTGAIPIRERGTTIRQVKAQDDWQGFIPKNQMPVQMNPERDWLGTSNHDVIPDDYPYYYSNHFSPNYRYLRTSEWMSENETRSAEDHWQLIRDVKNKHAERLVPIFANAIDGVAGLEDLHRSLAAWDYLDTTDATGATVFHLMHEFLIRATFEDKLSKPVFERFLGSRYYWLQRTDNLIVAGDSDWFDIRATVETENLNDLLRLAAHQTRDALQEKLGTNPEDWRWGRFHQAKFVSPLRQSGLGADFLGGGTHAVNGSGETLNRGQYSLNTGPYHSQWFSSMRMVADMSDDKKVMASVSGGNAARQFHPYFKSQLETWLREEWVPWWLDTQQIEKNSKHQVVLTPE